MSVWTTRNGRTIPTESLTDQHLTNILRQLQKNAELKRLAVVDVYENMSDMTGDVRVHFARMYDEVMEQSWRDYVDDVFQMLEAEAAHRNLSWDLFENRPVMIDSVDLSKYGHLERLIVGAIRDAINQHGHINSSSAPSAAKRVMGAIKSYNKRKR